MERIAQGMSMPKAVEYLHKHKNSAALVQATTKFPPKGIFNGAALGLLLVLS